MNKQLAISEVKNILNKNTYIELIKNKNFNKIDKELIRILKNILEETTIIVEKNKLNKYIEEFENIENRILIYINNIKFNDNLSTNIKLKIPWLKKQAEIEYLNNLKSNFDLLEIKKDLIDMFSLIELTIFHIEELTIFYNDYYIELNNLIIQIKKILKQTEIEKNKLWKDDENIVFFEWLELDLNNLIVNFIQTKEILNSFIKRIDNLKNTLTYFNNRFKEVFKSLISLRTKLIKWKLKNNIAISEYKQIYYNLKNINK